MLRKSLRKLVGAASLALLATVGFNANDAFAQKGGTGVMNGEVTWPTTFTLGIGGGANDNFNGSGGYNPAPTATNPGEYTQSHGFAAPYFHILAEIPIAKNFMFAPRIQYNDYSLLWDNPAGNTSGTGLVISQNYIGADLLLKYSLSNFHLMAGANLSTPLAKPRYAFSQQISDAVTGPYIPNYAGFISGLKGGIGYDIPLNAKNTIWLTPEAFFTYSITNFSQPPDNGSRAQGAYFPVAVSGGASLKFALNGPPDAPPPAVLAATITAQGVMPDGSIVAEPVSPQQTLHTRASIPLLPYVFFEDGSAAINARYNRSGATGFDVNNALSGKDALDANHALLDIVGSRLKAAPADNLKITGTNSNSGQEKNNITLSKARATAVAEYLENTWGIAASRITIDQRNLPELPTNPATQPGIQENRRVELSSNDPEITAPIKLENRQNLSVGDTKVKFNMSVSPDPSTHNYSSWSVMLDKDGTQIGQTMSGSGAPPASTMLDVPNAAAYLNQPVHYVLNVTDADGVKATAEGFTRIVPQTVSRDNLEKYAMLSFDFDKADINQRARQMLQLISESVSRDATGVKIDGFCDATGTPEYNQQLSEARANAAVTALRSMTTLPANVTVHGHGLRDPKFTNDLPEGRQLNRRVEFSIEKSSQ